VWSYRKLCDPTWRHGFDHARYFEMRGHKDPSPNWRDFQRGLQNSRPRSDFVKGCHIWGLGWAFSSRSSHRGLYGLMDFPPSRPQRPRLERKVQEEKKPPERIPRDELPQVLAGLNLGSQPASRNYTLVRNGAILDVETSLLPPLQNCLQGLLRQSLTVRAAAVVLKPSHGRGSRVLGLQERRQQERR